MNEENLVDLSSVGESEKNKKWVGGPGIFLNELNY